MMSLLAVEAGEQASFAVLPALILTPLIAAAIIAVLPKHRESDIRIVAVLGSAITGAISVWMLADFDKAEAGYQFVVSQTWVADLGLSWSLGVDGISLFLVVMTGILFPVGILATQAHHDPKPYYIWTQT